MISRRATRRAAARRSAAAGARGVELLQRNGCRLPRLWCCHNHLVVITGSADCFRCHNL